LVAVGSASFSEEKEAKRLLFRWVMGFGGVNAQGPACKSFCALFSKSAAC
jgi:hypothetical protein